MPKSKKRGGEKAHNKRIKQRNEMSKSFWQKQVDMAYKKHEEWKKSKSEQPVEFNVEKDTNN